ncbi:MAG: CynX/NimT family MFS transporter [Coriobacteriales bacterium]|jgi:MFS family permease
MSRAQRTRIQTQITDSPISPHRRGPFFGYLVVAALILVCFCPVSFGMSCAGIFYASLAEHFGVGTGMLSYYSSLLQLAALVFLPVFGRLFGTVDARKLVCGATLLIGIDFLLLSRAASLWMFYACSFIMGIGLAVLLFIAPSTLVNRWFAKRAGFFTGIVMAFTGVGGVVWSSVGGAIINSMGWSAAYMAFAVITIATVPVCWLCIASYPADKGLVPYGTEVVPGASPQVTRIPHASPTQRHSALPGAKPSNVFRTPAFALIFALCALLNMAMYAYFIIPSYIGSLEIGAALPLLGASAASAAMAGQTVAKIALGFVGDRKPVAATCAALGCGMLGIFLLLFFPVSTVAIFAGACLFGVQYGIAFVMMPIFTRRAFGAGNYANTYARVSMAASISSVIAGLAGGTIVDSGGGFALVFAIVLGISALAIIMTLAVGRAIARSSIEDVLQPAVTPVLASFIPSQVTPFVQLPEHAAAMAAAREAGAGSSLGEAELDLLSRKLRTVIDSYDACSAGQVPAGNGARLAASTAGAVCLAEFIPARVDAFVRVDGHVPAAQPSAYGEKQIDSEHLGLLGRKLRGVIDALDRNDSAEFDRDVRFVYGG